MKILITGAGGQLGLELQEIFNKNACREGKLPTAFLNVEVLAAGTNELDVTNQALADEFLCKHKPDILLNCAGYTAVDQAESDEVNCMRVNSEAAAMLAQLCSSYHIKYVYTSSESVFGGKRNIPFTETDITVPSNVYGKSKLLGEQKILAQNPEALILRAGWLYGFYGKNFVKTVGRLAQSRESITVVSDQYGNPTNVDVLCFNMLCLLNVGATGIFHCVDNGVISRHTFAKTVVKELELPCIVKPCSTKEYPLPAQRSPYMGMCPGKLEQLLNRKQRDWHAVLIDYIVESRKRGIWE